MTRGKTCTLSGWLNGTISRRYLTPLLEATLGVGFAVLSQAALWTADRELVLPRWIIISGGGISVLLLSTLRMLFPPSDNRPRGAT
jgi:hypothetical protein